MSHLDYYIKHGISPVRYAAANTGVHLERRGSLYRSLGLAPLAFRHADVLEVAAGSGQNSLYVAAQRPASLTLLEPNPTGARDIEEVYAAQPFPHTRPTLIAQKLEDFRPSRDFDVVICENWLGNSRHERQLLQKLAGFVGERGVLILTVVSPIGFMPNVLRRAMAARLCSPDATFEENTERLVRAFGPHLATLAAMTRTAVDWVHDNMLNPAYFDLCLAAPTVVADLQNDFDIFGSSPQFVQDWRWFKALHGAERRFNDHFLEEYFSQCPSFLDYRSAPGRSDMARNRVLESACFELIDTVRRLESRQDVMPELRRQLAEISELVDPVASVATRRALSQGVRLVTAPVLKIEEVAAATEFGALFGRETLYLSFMKATR